MACDSGTAAGIALGCIFGTLMVVAIVLFILYLYWKKRQRKENPNNGKKWETTENPVYDNKAYTRDADKTSASRTHNGEAKRGGHGALPAAYTECREKTSTSRKDMVDSAAHVGRSKPKTRRDIFANSRVVSKSGDFPIHKAGSHSSLDGATTPNYPEVISVSLQSQDIIGLGFNISGSLSEGIFVSQVHNRGPASESGRIQVGDRILSITISMNNMVYEDALTILSYASPYPVILQLRKATPLPSDDASIEDHAKLNHPVYRSQSLDDLSKINRDRWTGPRKTWTQIRRVHRTKEEDRNEVEGELRKWSATQNMESEGGAYSRAVDGKSSNSNQSTDVSLDMDEILSASVAGTTAAQVVHVEIPDQSTSAEHGIKRKSESEDTEADAKRLKDVSLNGIQQDGGDYTIDGSAADNEVRTTTSLAAAEAKQRNSSGSSSNTSADNVSVSSLSSDDSVTGGERVVAGSYDVTEVIDTSSSSVSRDVINESSSKVMTTRTEERSVTFADINENKVIIESQSFPAEDDDDVHAADTTEDTLEAEVPGNQPEVKTNIPKIDSEAVEESNITSLDPSTTDITSSGDISTDMTFGDLSTDLTFGDISTDLIFGDLSTDMTLGDLSMEVNVQDESILQREDPDATAEIQLHDLPDLTLNSDAGADVDTAALDLDTHDDEVRGILNDFFSDDPSLLAQFGFMGGDAEEETSNNNKTIELSTTSVSAESESVSKSVSSVETIESCVTVK